LIVWFVDLLNKGHIKHDFYEKVVTKMRTNFPTYAIFCCYIVREVVGKLDWNNLADRNKGVIQRTDPSDEWFAMIVMENNWNKWLHKHITSKGGRPEKHGITSDEQRYARAKDKGKIAGYTEEGIRRILELKEKVKQVRRKYGRQFDEGTNGSGKKVRMSYKEFHEKYLGKSRKAHSIRRSKKEEEEGGGC
jgi:hypothetical protein